jgi:hypothetical protein
MVASPAVDGVDAPEPSAIGGQRRGFVGFIFTPIKGDFCAPFTWLAENDTVIVRRKGGPGVDIEERFHGRLALDKPWKYAHPGVPEQRGLKTTEKKKRNGPISVWILAPKGHSSWIATIVRIQRKNGLLSSPQTCLSRVPDSRICGVMSATRGRNYVPSRDICNPISPMHPGLRRIRL